MGPAASIQLAGVTVRLLAVNMKMSANMKKADRMLGMKVRATSLCWNVPRSTTTFRILANFVILFGFHGPWPA